MPNPSWPRPDPELMPLYSDVVVACALVVVAVVAAVSTAKVRKVNRRFRMFDAISRAADEGATLDETLEAIAEILIPGLGDLCAIDVIEADGVPSHLTIIQHVSPQLDNAVMYAVRQWRYKPQTCGGKPVRVQDNVVVAFTLNQ